MIRSSIYHVTAAGRIWGVKREDDDLSFTPAPDKDSAVRYGRELARAAHGRLVIHREDGSVHAEHGYD